MIQLSKSPTTPSFSPEFSAGVCEICLRLLPNEERKIYDNKCWTNKAWCESQKSVLLPHCVTQMFLTSVCIVHPNAERTQMITNVRQTNVGWKMKIFSYTSFCWISNIVLSVTLSDQKFSLFCTSFLFLFLVSNHVSQVFWNLVICQPLVKEFHHPPHIILSGLP